MKTTISSLRLSKNRKKSNDQVALLSTPLPPPRPSVWGVQDNVGIYPTTRAVESFDRSTVISPTAVTNNTPPALGKSTLTKVPMENRFMPQYEPRKGQTPEDVIEGAALQFVPAYEEATTFPTQLPIQTIPSSRQSNAQSPVTKGSLLKTTTSPKAFRKSYSFENRIVDDNSADGSWDAIIDTEYSPERRRSWRGMHKTSPNREMSLERSTSFAEEKKSGSPLLSRRRQPSRGISTSLSPASTTGSLTAQPVPAIMVPLLFEDEEKSVYSMTPSTISSAVRRGTRVARLKQLFSSRAVVANTMPSTIQRQVSTIATPDDGSQKVITRTILTKKPIPNNNSGTMKIPPASPSSSAISGSSAGFVWPGTQDKRGKTVKMESSYDDSSVGPTAFQKIDFEKELDVAADLEMRKWMDEPTSFDESSLDTRDYLRPPTQKIDHEESVNDILEEDYSDEDTHNAADFHLAAVLADVSMNSPLSSTRPLRGTVIKKLPDPPASKNGLTNYNRGTRLSFARTPKSIATSSVATSASGALSIHNLFGSDRPREAISHPSIPEFKEDPWHVEESSHQHSSSGTSVSKDSSAYFPATKVSPGIELLALHNGSSRFGVKHNMSSIASVMRRNIVTAQSSGFTEEALALNEKLSPSPRNFNAHLVLGYDGYINKTREIPNLMDFADSDSMESSAKASSAVYSENNTRAALRGIPTRRGKYIRDSGTFFDSGSDVFDGISHEVIDHFPPNNRNARTRAAQSGKHQRDRSMVSREVQAKRSATSGNDDKINVVLLGGGLTTIQTTQDHFDNRVTPSDFDENLTNSDVDQFGFARTPGFNEMLAAGRSSHESAKFVLPKKFLSNDTNQTVFFKRTNMAKDPTGARSDPRGMFGNTFGTTCLHSSESEDSLNYEGFSRIDPFENFNGDLSKYRVHPNQVKTLVRVYRKMCRPLYPDLTIEELNQREDSKKAFALTEMRSRIMEKDIERGLERQGGTTIVDDLVLTPHNQAAFRVRDAVIVSKAWRDGASPRDVITAYSLTRRSNTHYVQRTVRLRGGSSSNKSASISSDSGSTMSEYSYNGSRAYMFEEVQWIDDTDFSLLRCPSLGPRCMHGFEMFTIGDCQSILLKLTNERCIQLREELNEATAIQIDAEELMKDEGDNADSMMTDAEMIYLSAMEDVKIISKQLVVAERSFHLVRDRIEKLVAKYEALLVQLENESVATGSIVTQEGSFYSDDDNSQYSSEKEEDVEREMFQRRVQRAEIRAELAAREAMMAKQEAQKIKEEKQAEIDILQQKLAELQSEASFTISQREHSAILAKAIVPKSNAYVDTTPSRNGRAGSPKIDKEKINGVKQKFRDRIALKKHGMISNTSFASEDSSSAILSYTQSFDNAARRMEARDPLSKNHRHRLVGEEMIQYLDFYERSLKAVEESRAK